MDVFVVSGDILWGSATVTYLKPNLGNSVWEATSITAVTDETQVYFDITVTYSSEEASNSLEKKQCFFWENIRSPKIS